MPEPPEPPSPPFKLGELVDVGSLDVEALLVMTFEIVLLPLTVTMVVVTTGAVSLLGASVIVLKMVWLSAGVKDSAIDVGISLDAANIEVVDGSSAVDCGVDDAGSAVEVGS
jgi:hypothetical protein